MDSKKGLILVFFTAVISGFSIFINKFSIAKIDPYIFTFAKNILVALFFISIILFLKESKKIKQLSKKQWLKLSAIGLIGGSIPFLLFFKGLSITSGIKAAFIHKTMFLFVMVFALLFLKEKLDKRITIAAVLLLIGNALLLKLTPMSLNTGDLMILTATLLWAGENTLSKHVLKEITPNIVAFSRMFFGSIFILIFLAFTGNLQNIATINLTSLAWIGITSIFLLLYVFTWYNGLKDVKVTLATSILLIGSIITTSLNYIFLETAITTAQAFGMLFIIAGIISMIIYSRQPVQLHTHNVSSQSH